MLNNTLRSLDPFNLSNSGYNVNISLVLKDQEDDISDNSSFSNNKSPLKRTSFPTRILEDEPFISNSNPSFSNNVNNDEIYDIKGAQKTNKMSYNRPNLNHQKNENEHFSKMVEAIYEFPGEMGDDLAIYPGDKIRVLEESKNGWWVGYNFTSKKTGLFPSNFVKETN